jgi:hypothetical protein
MNMAKRHPQPASVGSEPAIETTIPMKIMGLQFEVRAPYSAGHLCTAGEARALNQTRLENIRNNLAAKAKQGALTQEYGDTYIASYEFGERTGGSRTHDPIEAEALEIARQLARKKGQSTKENTAAARDLLQSEKREAIRAQAAKRVAELKELMAG